jgi:hypothetical protein
MQSNAEMAQKLLGRRIAKVDGILIKKLDLRMMEKCRMQCRI